MAKKETELHFPDNTVKYLSAQSNWHRRKIKELTNSLTVDIPGEELTNAERDVIKETIAKYKIEAKYWDKKANEYVATF